MVLSRYRLNFQRGKITLYVVYIIFQNLRRQNNKTLLFSLELNTEF